MKALIQRVREASVVVDETEVARIGRGMVVFLGIGKLDGPGDCAALAEKIVQLRIFDDERGLMNISARDCGASFLVISQFTLYGDCRKGRRPSFDQAMNPDDARSLYEFFLSALSGHSLEVQSGRFGASMQVHLINDGPVTFLVESGQIHGGTAGENE